MGIADNLYQATGNEQSNYNKHFGRGVPSRGMADQPRGKPQRRRKPHPSQHNKNKTGERLRNNKRGLRSKHRTEDRKKKRSSARAWSRQLNRYYRGHTLTGKASSGRRKQLAHDSSRKEFNHFRHATKAATAEKDPDQKLLIRAAANVYVF